MMCLEINEKVLPLTKYLSSVNKSVLWSTLLIPVHKKLSQEDHYKSKVTLNYMWVQC